MVRTGRLWIVAIAMGTVLSVHSAAADSGIRLEPAPPPKAGEFGELAFEVSAPWMKGELLMRFPETLASRQGYHFIDHFRADMPPVSMLDPVPEWRVESGSNEVSYSCVTKEGVAFGGRAWLDDERIEMEFFAENRSDAAMERIMIQMCLTMSRTDAFGKTSDLTDTYAWIDGRSQSLTGTTPTPEEKNRTPWILVLTRKGAKEYGGGREWTDGWWVVDQTADEDIIMRVSADRKHLVAIAWDDVPLYLMTNTAIPCLHAGPTNAVSLEPGEKYVWRGRIFLMENDPGGLLEQHRRPRRP